MSFFAQIFYKYGLNCVLGSKLSSYHNCSFSKEKFKNYTTHKSRRIIIYNLRHYFLKIYNIHSLHKFFIKHIKNSFSRNKSFLGNWYILCLFYDLLLVLNNAKLKYKYRITSPLSFPFVGTSLFKERGCSVGLPSQSILCY